VDQDKWLELLQRSVEQHGWRVFAFALMTITSSSRRPSPTCPGACNVEWPELSHLRTRPDLETVVCRAAQHFGVDATGWGADFSTHNTVGAVFRSVAARTRRTPRSSS